MGMPVALRSSRLEISELAAADLDDDRALDRITRPLELHVTRDAFVSGDVGQRIASGLTVGFAGVLERLEEQTEGVISQRGHVIRRFGVSRLIRLNEGLRLGRGDVRGVVRREISALAIAAALRDDFQVAPRV